MQPWIRSARFDSWFILSPPFWALVIVAVLPERYRSTDAMPLWGWFGLVVLIDVAHVYSTLFRTYWNPVRFRRQRTLLLTVPAVCYVVSVLLHSVNGLWFWRALAYVAVFHFVRQQYGFLRLYSRYEPRRFHHLDVVVIYAATLYPILHWHLSPGRQFNWFVDNDFWQIDWPLGRTVASWLYGTLLLTYLLKETYLWFTTRIVNWPGNGLVLGTALSWYVGIVLFNGDLVFTLLNVVAHGIPYMALIWVSDQPFARYRRTGQRLAVPLAVVGFLAALSGLAYLEEGLWDGLVWREHGAAFALFQALPTVTEATYLSLLVPLLALRQLTHYVLDGFIWRRQTHEAGTR